MQHAEETRLQALELYADLGLNETARRMDGIVSKGTIFKWAKEAGIPAPTRQTKLTPALARGRTYHKAQRLKLNDRLFARIEKVLKREGGNITPNKLKDLVLSYAILTDKRRLEEQETQTDQATVEELQRIYLDGERKLQEWRKHAEANGYTRRKDEPLALVKDVAAERASRQAQR